MPEHVAGSAAIPPHEVMRALTDDGIISGGDTFLTFRGVSAGHWDVIVGPNAHALYTRAWVMQHDGEPACFCGSSQPLRALLTELEAVGLGHSGTEVLAAKSRGLRLWEVGEESEALCPTCKDWRTTTFRLRPFALEKTGIVVPALLVGVCNECDTTADIPHQSVVQIKAALDQGRGAEL